MSKADISARGSGVDGAKQQRRSIGAADFLYLAAAPTFAIMALLTAVLGGGPWMRCVRSRVRRR